MEIQLNIKSSTVPQMLEMLCLLEVFPCLMYQCMFIDEFSKVLTTGAMLVLVDDKQIFAPQNITLNNLNEIFTVIKIC